MVRTADGKRKTIYNDEGLGPGDWAKAAAWAESAARAGTRRAPADEPTMDELAQAYLTWVFRRVDAGACKRSTYDSHRKRLDLACRAAVVGTATTLGDLRVGEFTPQVLRGIVGRWTTGIGAATVRNRCKSLMIMLNWAAGARDDRTPERLIAANPIAGFAIPRAPYRGDRYAPAAEVGAFLAFVDARAARATGKFARFERLTALLVRVAAETGCRPGELCAARWEHFDPGLHAIVLPPALHKTGSSTDRPRRIMLPAPLAARIEAERAAGDRHPTHVFCHRASTHDRSPGAVAHGVPWDPHALARRVRKLRRAAIKAGVPVEDAGLKRLHLYRLRHAFATDAAQKGTPLTDAAALLGNSVKTMESTYIHYQGAHLRAVADPIAGGDGAG